MSSRTIEEQIEEMVNFNQEEKSTGGCFDGCFSVDAVNRLKQENVNLKYDNAVLTKRIEAAENGNTLPMPACFAGVESGMSSNSPILSPEEQEDSAAACFAAFSLPFKYLESKCTNDRLKREKRDLEQRLAELQNEKSFTASCASGCTDFINGLCNFESSNTGDEYDEGKKMGLLEDIFGKRKCAEEE